MIYHAKTAVKRSFLAPGIKVDFCEFTGLGGTVVTRRADKKGRPRSGKWGWALQVYTRGFASAAQPDSTK